MIIQMMNKYVYYNLIAFIFIFQKVIYDYYIYVIKLFLLPTSFMFICI